MITYDVIMTPSDDGSWVLKSAAVKELRYQKYKRCLAMARICEEKSVLPYALVEKDLWKFTSNYWQRWHDRWLELAEQFNPNPTATKENSNG